MLELTDLFQGVIEGICQLVTLLDPWPQIVREESHGAHDVAAQHTEAPSQGTSDGNGLLLTHLWTDRMYNAS